MPPEVLTTGPWAIAGMLALYLLQRLNIVPSPGPRPPNPPVPTPAPGPLPEPPNQAPILELIFKLLAERFKLPFGDTLPPPRMEQFASTPLFEHAHATPPPWAQVLLEEVRSLRSRAP